MSELLRTRILFSENGSPVGHLSVHARDLSTPRVTDATGQVEVPLVEGKNTIQIHLHGQWLPQVVMCSKESSLIMVELGRDAPSGEHIAAETSFVDIGNLNLGGRYVFEDVIGRGGMSVVLKARDRLLNRPVAVKLLADELQDREEAQNIFLTEARNLATLSHPNLVAVHDICKIDDRVFMVIEYIEGQNLEVVLGQLEKFNLSLALQTAIQLSRVVGYLHNQGIIHRDLKPANAMIRNDGTLKLIDFGLARHFDELYIKGTRVRGTPAYMSPEQVKGEPLTPASDVYQLGVCLFEMLTGRIPFDQGDLGYAHVHMQPPRVEAFVDGIPNQLSDLIEYCLTKSPDRRPRDGNELLRHLQWVYGMVSGGGQEDLLAQLEAESETESIRHSTLGSSDSVPGLIESSGIYSTGGFSERQLDDALSSASVMDIPVMTPSEIDVFEPETQKSSVLPIVIVGLAAALLAGVVVYFTLESRTSEVPAVAARMPTVEAPKEKIVEMPAEPDEPVDEEPEVPPINTSLTVAMAVAHQVVATSALTSIPQKPVVITRFAPRAKVAAVVAPAVADKDDLPESDKGAPQVESVHDEVEEVAIHALDEAEMTESEGKQDEPETPVKFKHGFLPF